MKKIILILCVLFVNNLFAQDLTPVEYIEKYKDLAIREMKRMGVPAAITLAQGILESESGNSELVKKSNNHFGIKCKSSWTAGGVSHDDDAKGECFRVYKTAEDSYRDHSNFLRNNQRYSNLFKLDIVDYKGWAYGLKKAGYATNPRYPEIVIGNIEKYNLQQYTVGAAADAPKFDVATFEDDKEEVTTNGNKEDEEENVSTLDLSNTIVKINGSKCVLVNKGTSLLVIATKNNIPLSKLLEYNEISEDGILPKDQYIFLQKKAKTGDKYFYIVQKGETLFDVAQKNGIQLQYLIDYNKINDSKQLAAGTKLLLKPIEKKVENNKGMHTVATKESLYSIAKKYNITVNQLREWNNLTSDSLRIGQQLKITE
jgi:LysM repeat protein